MVKLVREASLVGIIRFIGMVLIHNLIIPTKRALRGPFCLEIQKQAISLFRLRGCFLLQPLNALPYLQSIMLIKHVQVLLLYQNHLHLDSSYI